MPRRLRQFLENEGVWDERDVPLLELMQPIAKVINAKGDLIIGNEDAEPERLPIGNPNYFMVVDPTQDRGYKFTNEIDGGTF